MRRSSDRAAARPSGAALPSPPLDDALLRELFATPPSDFVSARNELAKTLRREKRRDEATAVAALRRPGWDEWALNVAAAEHGDEVSSFAEAATAVRDAQAAAIEGREGPDVRAALRELRERSARLVTVAAAVLGGVGRQAGGGELNGRLSEVAGSGSAVEQLRVGLLGMGGDPPGELFAGLEPAERRPSRSASAPPPSTERSRPEKVGRDRRGEQEEARRRKEALQATTRARREATKVLARADAELDAATAAARRAHQARDEAARVLAAIDADVERAQASRDVVDAPEA